MQHTEFASSGRDVSRLGFGAMGFAGWFEQQPEADHIAALLLALERGVTFIDTARGYGDSERIVGAGLRQWHGPAPFVATKVEALAGDHPMGHRRAGGSGFPQGARSRPPAKIRCARSVSTASICSRFILIGRIGASRVPGWRNCSG